MRILKDFLTLFLQNLSNWTRKLREQNFLRIGIHHTIVCVICNYKKNDSPRQSASLE